MTLPFPEPPPTITEPIVSSSSKRLSLLSEAHDLPPPDLDHRWVHGGAQHLDLLSTPITSLVHNYVPFSFKENERLEAAYQLLSEEKKLEVGRISGRAREEEAKRKKAEEDKAVKTKGKVSGLGSTPSSVVMGKSISQDAEDKSRPPATTAIIPAPSNGIPESTKTRPSLAESQLPPLPTYYPDPDEHAPSHFPFPTTSPQSKPTTTTQTRPSAPAPAPSPTPQTSGEDALIHPNTTTNIPVSQDGLFSVSLYDMSLFPVFWAHTGGRVPVLRATWFMGGVEAPCEWELAEELERGYQTIQPWQASYSHELQKALEQGGGAEEKLRHRLPAKFGVGVSVVYKDESEGEIVTSGMTSYLSKLFWSSIRSKPGTQVYRGYQAALEANPKPKSTPSRSRRASGATTDRDKANASSRRGSFSSTKSDGGKSSNAQAHATMEASGGERSIRTSLDLDEHLRKTTLEGEAARMRNEKDIHTQANRVPGPQPSASKLTAKVNQATGKIVDKLGEVKAQMDELALLDGSGAGSSAVEDGDSHDAYRNRRPRRRGKSDARDEEQVPVTADEADDQVCTDLILVVHGIGQQLATQYESFNFVYATNMLRSVMKTQASNPALASIIRDRRTQILPIQWRANLELEEEDNEEAKVHGMDNRFTMSDITLGKIPAIRQITNSVLLDIPLFMSHHRQRMIEAVCSRANRAYRMWCERNPGFDGVGRVHVIAHSLGSALAAHILSNQPTRMPPMSRLPRQILSSTKNQFLFNTSNLFLCGSPLGIFLHLDQAQIMPRKGRERTMNSPRDEALDRAGRFGCMSCDTIYNIIHVSDPVAYALNATVDSTLARTRPPLPITSVTAPFFASVTEPLAGLTKYLPGAGYIPEWIGGSGGGGTTGEKGKAGRKPNILRLPSGIEMSGPEGEERLIGTRAERRFSALNPHGNVDFVLPSGGVSEYLDAITAHQNYWSDPNFGSFLLAEIFSTKLDLLRTGMGLAQRDGHISHDLSI